MKKKNLIVPPKPNFRQSSYEKPAPEPIGLRTFMFWLPLEGRSVGEESLLESKILERAQQLALKYQTIVEAIEVGLSVRPKTIYRTKNGVKND